MNKLDRLKKQALDLTEEIITTYGNTDKPTRHSKRAGELLALVKNTQAENDQNDQ